MRRVDFSSRDRTLLLPQKSVRLSAAIAEHFAPVPSAAPAKQDQHLQCMVKDGEVNFTSRDGSHGSSYPRSLEWRRKGKFSHSDE